jgi:hypothetical protein
MPCPPASSSFCFMPQTAVLGNVAMNVVFHLLNDQPSAGVEALANLSNPIADDTVDTEAVASSPTPGRFNTSKRLLTTRIGYGPSSRWRKNSGYGRELSRHGIREFTNKKTCGYNRWASSGSVSTGCPSYRVADVFAYFRYGNWTTYRRISPHTGLLLAFFWFRCRPAYGQFSPTTRGSYV